MTLTQEQAHDEAVRTAEAWRSGIRLVVDKQMELHRHNVMERIKHFKFIPIDPTTQQKQYEANTISYLHWRLDIIDMASGVADLMLERIELQADEQPRFNDLQDTYREIIDQYLDSQLIYYFQYHQAVWFGLMDGGLYSEALEAVEDSASLGDWLEGSYPTNAHQQIYNHEFYSWRAGTVALAWWITEKHIRKELDYALGVQENAPSVADYIKNAYDIANEEVENGI